jgi:hypothetical protein
MAQYYELLLNTHAHEVDGEAEAHDHWILLLVKHYYRFI